MFLGNALSSATSGLDSVERQLAVVSQNVANASTPNYVRETLPLSSVDSRGGPAGVRTGVAQREIDTYLQGHLLAATGNEAGTNVTQSALAGIDSISGAPGSGEDLASRLGALRDSYSALSTDPASGSQQLDVLNKAGALVSGINTLGASLVQARQTAQDTLQQDVTTANAALQSIGQLSNQIIAAKATGQSTASLEDQRDAAKSQLATLVGAKFVDQPNGDTLVIAGSSVLPTRADKGPFSLASVNFTGGTPAATVPQLLLGNNPVAGLGGEVGANLTLRDTTLPAMHAKLDGFAQSLATSFNSAGVPLLVDGSGNVPSGTPQGLAEDLQVSPAVQATPTILRDGTGAPGAAGDTSTIQNVLTTVFSSAADGAPAQASNLVAGFAGSATKAQADATSATSLRTGLQSRLSSQSGVTVDSELAHMIQLQNAYAANAKMVSAVQSMWDQLIQAVR